MALALYHPELGYYASRGQRSGRAGDFYTSVDVGAIFGELIAVQIAEMAAALTGPFDLVEAAAGNGRLMRDVLDALQRELPHDAYCLIAVTLEDLYPGDVDHAYVFGYARLRARVGVFSFARYHPDFFGESFAVDRQVVLQRALKVMSHELGHMFGLEHCTHLRCIMNGANHLSEVDRAPLDPCPVCLRKLHVALGFDPEARYQALAEHYTRLGLHEAADWSRQRWAYLRRQAAR